MQRLVWEGLEIWDRIILLYGEAEDAYFWDRKRIEISSKSHIREFILPKLSSDSCLAVLEFIVK